MTWSQMTSIMMVSSSRGRASRRLRSILAYRYTIAGAKELCLDQELLVPSQLLGYPGWTSILDLSPLSMRLKLKLRVANSELAGNIRAFINRCKTLIIAKPLLTRCKFKSQLISQSFMVITALAVLVKWTKFNSDSFQLWKWESVLLKLTRFASTARPTTFSTIMKQW